MSDVCSSDLPLLQFFRRALFGEEPGIELELVRALRHEGVQAKRADEVTRLIGRVDERPQDVGENTAGLRRRRRQDADLFRSEEHTSELQSLMRISYAVFCLNKTNN